jgi:hypothetical protein
MTDTTTLARPTLIDDERDALSAGEVELPFTLIAMTSPSAIEARTRCRRVGQFASLEAAIQGRVDDVLEQLAANDGWLVTAEHVIVGPGHDTRAEVYTYVTQVGSDPDSERVPLPYDPGATRRWLLATHQLTG